jgi:hypothetical protein
MPRPRCSDRGRVFRPSGTSAGRRRRRWLARAGGTDLDRHGCRANLAAMVLRTMVQQPMGGDLCSKSPAPQGRAYLHGSPAHGARVGRDRASAARHGRHVTIGAICPTTWRLRQLTCRDHSCRPARHQRHGHPVERGPLRALDEVPVVLTITR